MLLWLLEYTESLNIRTFYSVLSNKEGTTSNQEGLMTVTDSRLWSAFCVFYLHAKILFSWSLCVLLRLLGDSGIPFFDMVIV
jgi:hypothetical protein